MLGLFLSCTVLMQAQQGPTISCVPGFPITCETDIQINVDAPFVTTDCTIGPDVIVTASNPVIEGPRGCSGATYTVTYTATDECGLTASCNQVFTIANQVGPSILSCPANQTVSCSYNVFPQPNLVEVESPCGLMGDIEVLGPQVFGPEECSNTQYIYTYIARDQCGRSTQCQQTFTLSNGGPEFVCPPDICVLDCPADGDMIAAQFASFASQATIVNPCGNVSTVNNNFDPNRFINANCGSGTIAYDNAVQYQIVTFTASDACFGFDNCTALVVVVDNTPPVITGAPQLGIRECNDLSQSQYEDWIQQNINNMSAEDACSNVTWSVTPDVPVEVCGANGYAITEVFFTATDDCGNSTTLEAHFKLKNNFPPEFVNPIANIEAACGDPVNFVEPAIRNACGETVVTFEDSETPGSCAGAPTLVRTYTVTDVCGNAATVSQTITVTDSEGPVFTEVPATASFSCGETPVFADPVAIDACGGSVTLTFTEYEAGTGSCTDGQQINRDWTATDGCGNTTTITTTVILEGDDTPPVFVNVPAPVSFDCGEMPTFEAPAAEDDCSNPVTITFEEVPQTGDCTNGRQIDRIWTATDACGNTATVTTSIILEGDDTPPVFTFIPETPDVGCGNIPDFVEPVAEDACSIVTLTFFEYQTPGTICDEGYSLKRDWTATDACGNTSTVTTAIWVNIDVDAPVFTFVPETPDVGCGNIPDFVTPVAEDDCGTVTLTFSEYQTPGTICDEGYSLKREWTATDDCGNASTVTTAIWVNIDVDAPVFTFVPETPDVDCDEVPDFIEPIAEDDCGTVTLTFVEYQSPDDGVLCEDGIALKRDWTATDDCGNASTVTTVIWINAVNPTAATVAGSITNEAAESIDQVAVVAEGNGGAMMGNITTDAEGIYSFELTQGGNYAIEPRREDDVRNGITTFDLILMGQHLLNVQPLDSPYKLIAADVNNSGSVSSLDLIALRRMILHLDDEFDNNTSWRFVEADYIFSQPTNPFANTFPEVISINGLNGSYQADFIGIKIGDLNGTAIPNELFSGETRTGRLQQPLVVEDARLKPAVTTIIDVKAKDFITMLGYQMTMNIDPAKAEILEIIPGALRGLSSENFGYHGAHGATITTSWHTVQPLSFMDETVLFSLVIEAREEVMLSEILTVNSDITAAEAYSDQNGVMNVDLMFTTEKGFEKNNFTLYQNHPNPFEGETKIGFYLDNANEATLSIYSIDGKQLFQQKDTYEAGYHETVIRADQLGEGGMMYYQLDVPNRRPQTKKMVWLKL